MYLSFFTCMIRANALWAFYLHHCMAPLVVSALCCYIYWADAQFINLLLIKLVTNAGICYFVNTIHRNRLFYYYNLHISRRLLWMGYFTVDLFIFVIAICFIHQVM